MNRRVDQARATRAAILRAARALFAENGYEATTIRQIAACASVDPALVIRHFGDKRALHDAATELDLALPDLTTVARSRLGVRVVTEFLGRWDGPDGQPLRALLIAAATDGDAARRMRSVYEQQVRCFLERAASDRTDDRVALIVSTLMGLATTRYLLQLPDIADRSPDEVVSLYAPIVQRLLTGSF